MQTICFLATCQSQHILCTHCWVELSLMLSTLLYFIIVILILLVINRCLINCSHYLIYFAIVNSFLYVLFVGIPTCSKLVTSPPRFLHVLTRQGLVPLACLAVRVMSVTPGASSGACPRALGVLWRMDSRRGATLPPGRQTVPSCHPNTTLHTCWSCIF